MVRRLPWQKMQSKVTLTTQEALVLPIIIHTFNPQLLEPITARSFTDFAELALEYVGHGGKHAELSGLKAILDDKGIARAFRCLFDV